jgi:serine/threonine protein kinase
VRQDSPRWTEFAHSEYAHERDGLRLLAEYLPDADPYHVWSNVEFIASDGSINEVDALVLTPTGLCILELKHWYGEISGGAQDRIWQQRANPRARLFPHDNPIFLANRKAKRLAGMVRQLAGQHDQGLSVYVDSAIFLHAERTESHLAGHNTIDVYGRDGARTGLRSLKDYLTKRPRHITNDEARRIVALLSRSRIRPSVADRKVGPSLLLHPKPFVEGVGWQDYLAGHAADRSLIRRVRIYLTGGQPADETAAIQRAAEREFRLLQGIHHPGIPQAVDVIEHAWGTAVVFDHDRDLERLDHWLVREDRTLTLTERLQLVQQLAEIIGYAHSRHLMHRALHPAAVYVQDRPEGRTLVVTDWQTGGRLPTGSTVTQLSSSSDSANLDLFLTDELRRYQAPEASRGGKGAALDVFSLGSIAYRIFTGVDPATSAAELTERVRDGGLNMAASADGLPEPLLQLVYDATRGDPGQRLVGVVEFRSGLDEVWKKLTEPEPEPEVDPLVAHKGDVLPGGFRVEARLGSGSTAAALLVKADRYPQDVVLKVARSDAAEARLAQEAAKLAGLGGQWIAALREPEPIRVGQRLALVLEYAGKPLTEQLRGGRLALELLERYGRDLLEILAYLDGQAVWHRDLKPANLAARPRPKDRQPHLCVFDFSLAGVPDTDLTAGTVHYLDPFLGTGGRDRYDSAAERFAAAVTLYEMATGRLPRWGDDADPRAISDEVSLPESAFDPAIADRLVTFFGHALARGVADRFGTAEQMLVAWREIFRNIPQDSAGGRNELALDAPLSAAGLTPRARSALERLHQHTIGDLLDAKPSELTSAPGVTNATRREIIEKQKALRALLAPDEPEPDADAVSIEALCARLVPDSSKQRGKIEGLRLLLGQAADKHGAFLRWPSQNEVAARCDASQPQISTWLKERHRRWLNSLAGVRTEISELLADNGGVMSADELATALIAAHGSFTPEPQRTAQAIGLVRAAVEAEMDRGGDARVDILRPHRSELVLVGREPDDPDSTDTAEAALKAADSLGKAAVRLAPANAGVDEPLLSRQATVDALRTVELPPARVLSDERLLRLAAVASNGLVAVNAQGQLYPVGMPPTRTVRLCAGSLAGQRTSERAVRDRIAARFPRAAPLPPRPDLDDLLRLVPLHWDKDRYVSPAVESLSTGSAHTATAYGAAVPARQIDEAGDRISEALAHRRYLALLTPPRALTATRRAVLDRYGLTEVDVTALLLDTLRGLDIDWSLILAADTGQAGDPDYRELVTLVRHHVLPVLQTALDKPEPVLISEAAPLTRYGLLDPITALADPTQPRPAARLLLAAAHTPEPPMLDHSPVPHTTRSQVLWLDTVWANRTAERIPAR